MISVVEGPSAAGKTTWLRTLPTTHSVSEDWAALGFSPEQWPDVMTPAKIAYGVRRGVHAIKGRNINSIMEPDAIFGRCRTTIQ